ncbi:uncharacterized protein E0L32_000808 [Thyridium curvatum]|uniref:Zn(2)-C6 fungal-type domain-containing protein n=1 Tax=Thyridium curvatum TaxID=1093900 RepID=A0A507B6H4_9PEZI|nr:uncharacterized protein E0L32_000808 [Thyridium curvatum]TPX12631.1 hypothetical protein E0L32_000808 [Thyridium curvatum]
MASHSHSSSGNIDAGRSLKRRKTRKGTRSCWACKRRKVKCTYANPTDEVCIGCSRRCLECVGQEFPEQDPGPSSKSRLVGDRIGRLESMIQQLAEQVAGHVASPAISPSPPVSLSRSVPASLLPSAPCHETRSKCREISQALLAAFPSPSDLRIIAGTGDSLALYLPLALLSPASQLERRVAFESEKLWGPQEFTQDTHPVLIARRMLLLAGVLKHLHAAGSAGPSSTKYQQLVKLTRPPRALARNLAETATTLVTSHDKFTTDSIEGLECLWLEVLYHAHNGSPRLSWMTCRRAISAVHLMGFQGRRYGPSATPKSLTQQIDGQVVDLQVIWHRLVHSELALCLALDLPASVPYPDDTLTFLPDEVMTGDDDLSATIALERRHTSIASHLIERSVCDPHFEDLDTTHQILTELEQAMSAMQSGWRGTPSLSDVDDNKQLFGIMTKIKAQIFHSHLLLLAELPSMLQAILGETLTTTNNNSTTGHRQHEHSRNRNRISNSRNICVQASRDLLRRFNYLRSCERTAGYIRLVDHYAWLAAATLLLVRLLDSYARSPTALIGGMAATGAPNDAQLSEDRKMASIAMEGMRLAGDDEDDEDDGDDDVYSYTSVIAAKSAAEDVLPRLLALEAAGAEVVVTYRKPGGQLLGGSNSGAEAMGEDQDTLVLPIPFVGVVSITPQVQYMGYLPGAVGNEATGFQVSDDDGEEEMDDYDEEDYAEDEDGEDDEESILTRALRMRRNSKWGMAPTPANAPTPSSFTAHVRGTDLGAFLQDHPNEHNYSLFLSGFQSDATIFCKDESYPIHTNIVCFRSAWFRNVSSSIFRGEEREKSIKLNHEPRMIEALLVWIYTGILSPDFMMSIATKEGKHPEIQTLALLWEAAEYFGLDHAVVPVQREAWDFENRHNDNFANFVIRGEVLDEELFEDLVKDLTQSLPSLYDGTIRAEPTPSGEVAI